jgi:hypothetical protein
MKAEDLRLGNLIYNTKGEVDTVIIDALIYMLTYPDPICQAKPIPLTEEWLLKFGFNSNSPCKDFEDCGMPYYAKHGVLLFYNRNRLKHELCYYLIGYGSMRSGKYHISMIRWIMYVHQLQNLYFALTGEELTINDE